MPKLTIDDLKSGEELKLNRFRSEVREACTIWQRVDLTLAMEFEKERLDDIRKNEDDIHPSFQQYTEDIRNDLIWSTRDKRRRVAYIKYKGILLREDQEIIDEATESIFQKLKTGNGYGILMETNYLSEMEMLFEPDMKERCYRIGFDTCVPRGLRKKTRRFAREVGADWICAGFLLRYSIRNC